MILEYLPGSLAAVAAIASAIAAFLILRHQIFQEKNKVLLLKHQSEVEHLQKLIGCLARVIALASREWSDQRSQALDQAVEEMQLHVAALQSLSNTVRKDIDQWATKKDPDGNSVSALIYYDLSMQHAAVGERHKQFMQAKMDVLKVIQDKLFASMTKL